jgi:hypothetical protein
MTDSGVVYSPQAASVLGKLEGNAVNRPLWNAVCDALDIILDDPGSAAARRVSLRTAAGTTVWKVPARSIDDWVVLWFPGENDEIFVAYVGPL